MKSPFRTPLRAFRRRLAATACLAALAIGPTHAELPHENQVPANAIMVMGIPSTADWWNQAKALPFTQALMAFLDGPEMAQDLGYQQFQLERSKLAQELGFPVSFDEFMGNIFSNGLMYAIPAEGGAGKPSVALVMGVKDKDKAAKLVAKIDQTNADRAQPPAADPATTETTSLEATAFKFEKLKIGDVESSYFSTGTGSGGEGFYALMGDTLIFSDSRPMFEQVISKAAGGIDGNAEYAKLKGKLPWGEADLVGFIDADALAQSSGQASQVLGALPGMGQKNKVAFTLDMQPGGIEGHTLSTANPAQMTPNIKPEPLRGLAAIAPDPLVGVAYGLLDSEQAFQSISAWLGMASGGTTTTPFAPFEASTGISVEQELVPALGQEVVFAINGVQMASGQSLFPQVDLVMALRMKDEAKMQVVLEKFEKFVEGTIPPPMVTDPNAQGTPEPARFTQVEVPGGTMRTIETGMGPFAPSYAVRDGFVLLGVNTSSVEGALARAGGQPSVQGSPTFTQAAAGNPIYSFSMVNVGQIIGNVLAPYIPMIAGSGGGTEQQRAVAFITQVVSRLGTLSAAEHLDGDLAVGHVKISMQ